jgi:hypothetical protein
VQLYFNDVATGCFFCIDVRSCANLQASYEIELVREAMVYI